MNQSKILLLLLLLSNGILISMEHKNTSLRKSYELACCGLTGNAACLVLMAYSWGRIVSDYGWGPAFNGMFGVHEPDPVLECWSGCVPLSVTLCGTTSCANHADHSCCYARCQEMIERRLKVVSDVPPVVKKME